MLTVVTPAVVEPISVAAAKAHLRVTHSADDALIAALITSARELVELRTGLALAEATYRWTSTEPYTTGARLPVWPASGVTAVSYLGDAETWQAVDEYVFDPLRASLYVPSIYGRKISVVFTTAPTYVPASLLSAIKLRVQAEYEGDAASAKELVLAAERYESMHRVNLGV